VWFKIIGCFLLKSKETFCCIKININTLNKETTEIQWKYQLDLRNYMIKTPSGLGFMISLKIKTTNNIFLLHSLTFL